MEKRKTLKPHQPVAVKDAAFLQNTTKASRRRPRQIPGAGLAPARWWSLHRFGLDRDHARSGWRLDQCLDLSHPGARQEPRHGAVRSCRPAWRDHRQEILGPWPAVPARGGPRRGSRAVHCRFRISAGRAIGIRVRRRHQGRADRDLSGTGDRPADPGARGDRLRGPYAAAIPRCRKDRSASSRDTTHRRRVRPRSWR